MDQAVAILQKQGVSKEDIQKGLSIPVFFHKPFLTIKTPEGSRGVFFMTYQDATTAASKVQGTKPEIMLLISPMRWLRSLMTRKIALSSIRRKLSLR